MSENFVVVFWHYEDSRRRGWRWRWCKLCEWWCWLDRMNGNLSWDEILNEVSLLNVFEKFLSSFSLTQEEKNSFVKCKIFLLGLIRKVPHSKEMRSDSTQFCFTLNLSACDCCLQKLSSREHQQWETFKRRWWGNHRNKKIKKRHFKRHKQPNNNNNNEFLSFSSFHFGFCFPCHFWKFFFKQFFGFCRFFIGLDYESL